MSEGRLPSRISILLWVWLMATTACVEDRPAASGPSVILISVDTLRPDHLGAYGSPRPTSPTIDALAARGVLFEDVLATSPWTLPSHASLLTGRYPNRHGATAASRAIADDVPTLAVLLQDLGWQTSAIVNSVYLKKWGIDRGFEDFEYIREAVDSRDPSEVTGRAIRWLKRNGDRGPFFLFLHYYDVHSDYASHPEYEEMFVEPYAGPVNGTTRQLLLHRYGRLRLPRESATHLKQLYDAGIRQFDDQLATLLKFIESQEYGADSILLLTSDHGEEFLEHGGVLHGLNQYRETLRIPLIVVGPGVEAGRRIAAPVSLVDVMPTLLGLLGVSPPEGMDGLVVYQPGAPSPMTLSNRVIFTESDFTYELATRNKRLGSNRTARSGRFRLHQNLETDSRLLFDLAVDPFEQHDVRDEHPDVVAFLNEHLARHLEAGLESEAVPELSAEDRRFLESLGYVE